jgi:uncharacterized protein
MIDLVKRIKEIVKSKFENAEGSHDWNHIERVHRIATYLHSKEGGNLLVIELSALLHDISDHKYNGGDWNAGSQESKRILLNLGADEILANEVSLVVSHISYKGAGIDDKSISLEAKIVQDADRLDAIGAIGIARAFAYGGSKNRPLYQQNMKPEFHQTAEEYLNSKSHTINHFYEKLLLLKDRMKTKTACDLALQRHRFMEKFLDQFYSEWNFNS